ncbi:MAG: rubredoxin, partial [Gammaproteobacteria bacterium]
MTGTQAQEPRQFYDGLVTELETQRAALSDGARSFGGFAPMAHTELIEWLRFQCWYEREAANFIGSWLRDTPEPEAFFGLCRQVADEGRHCKLILSHLRSLGTSMAGWQPEPEWVEWVTEFYANGEDTLARVAAHNITGELGTLNAFDGLLPRVPESTRALLRKILPDEQFHIALGRTLVQRYATTAQRQARVRARVWEAFELEQRGRLAFERRLRELGVVDDHATVPVVVGDEAEVDERPLWICRVCGWIYDAATGDPDAGIAP